MNPAYSLVIFTTLSGLGCGFAFWLGVVVVFGAYALHHLAIIGFFCAFIFIGGGFLASILHLGHPRRIWRALSQWRSSWLSREGILGLAVLVLLVTYMVGFGYGALPIWGGRLLGGLIAVTGLLTVYATAMIYASLAAIRQWHSPHTPINFLVLALAGGATACTALARWSGNGEPILATSIGAASLLLVCAWTKRNYWRWIDQSISMISPEDATGLGGAMGRGSHGKVRAIDPLSHNDSFVMREMGYRVARRHANRLRRIVLVVGFFLPAGMLMCTMWLAGWYWQMVIDSGALILFLFGTIIERWLFFAQAIHAVNAFYRTANEDGDMWQPSSWTDL